MFDKVRTEVLKGAVVACLEGGSEQRHDGVGSGVFLAGGVTRRHVLVRGAA